jgi:glycerophosphoryl diester phosphodiesterase
MAEMQPLQTRNNRIKPLVCGHRGASGHTPENTIAAFREALEAGADWIEFDVQLSADGELIVLHDDTLERTTDLQQARRPTEFSLVELKKLDAGSWFGSGFAGERIPTLDEVLEEFRGRLGMNVEIKSRPGFETDNGIEHKVAEALVRHNLLDIDQVIVSSFDPGRIAALHALNERLPLGALYSPKHLPQSVDPFQLISLTGAKALHPPFKVVNETLMAQARKMGVLVNTWTVNELPDLQRMIDLDLHMIITNYPAQLRELVDTQKQEP